MGRSPPSEVRRILRQEVGLGCPVPGCRQAFLTWHHFDPPWNVEHHHRPEGMIALCRQHHDAADQGIFSRDELKKLKQSAIDAQPTIAELPWSKREFLIRLGGCYSGGVNVAVALSGQRAIWLRRTDDGLLLLSIQVRANDGSVLAVLEDNMFEADPSRLYDLETSTGGTRLKFWLSQRDIGLELSLKRVTLAELSAILEADRLRAEQESERQLPADVRDMIREAHLSGDSIGTFVKRWARSRCLDDEQKISLLNFENLILYSGRRRIVIRNGIAADGCSIVYSASFDNEGGGFNL